MKSLTISGECNECNDPVSAGNVYLQDMCFFYGQPFYRNLQTVEGRVGVLMVRSLLPIALSGSIINGATPSRSITEASSLGSRSRLFPNKKGFVRELMNHPSSPKWADESWWNWHDDLSTKKYNFLLRQSFLNHPQ